MNVEREESRMDVAVQVLAQVPAEAQCIGATVESVRALGEVTVFDCSGDPAIAEAAGRAGAPHVELVWEDDFSACFNAMLAHPPGARLLVYADEIVEGEVPEPGWSEGADTVGAILVRHRTSETDFFDEEREVRYAAPGADLGFRGRFPATPTSAGAVLDPEHVQALPIVLAHYPDRWPNLAEQRIRRTIAAVEAATREEPDDATHVYALLHCHVSLHDWPRVAELADRWRAVAEEDDDHASLVDYYQACAVLRSRRLREAERLLRQAVERTPAFGDAWFLIGELARLGRDLATARSAYERASSLGTDALPIAVEDHSLTTWRPLLELATIAEDRGRVADAARLRAEADARRAELRSAR
jgi:tetratricopeptide (TPR) repeat protein